MLSCNIYLLTWISLTLDEGYLFTATPPDLERGVAPQALLCPRSHSSLDMGLLLSADTLGLGHGVAFLASAPAWDAG